MSVLFILLNQIEYAAKAPPIRTGIYMLHFGLSNPFLGVSQESGGPGWHPENRERTTVALNPTLSM